MYVPQYSMVQRRDIRFSNRILQAIALRLEPLKPGLPEYEKVLGEQKLGSQLGRWVHPGCQELRRVGWQKGIWIVDRVDCCSFHS